MRKVALGIAVKVEEKENDGHYYTGKNGVYKTAVKDIKDNK